jgi:hypothetical protein
MFIYWAGQYSGQRVHTHNTKVDNFWVWASKLFAKLFSIMLAGKDWKDFQSCFGNSARRVKQSFWNFSQEARNGKPIGRGLCIPATLSEQKANEMDEYPPFYAALPGTVAIFHTNCLIFPICRAHAMLSARDIERTRLCLFVCFALGRITGHQDQLVGIPPMGVCPHELDKFLTMWYNTGSQQLFSSFLGDRMNTIP